MIILDSIFSVLLLWSLKATEQTTLKRGYSVVINSRDQDELSISKEEILRNNAGDSAQVVTFPGDIGQQEVCKGLIELLFKSLGG